MKTNIMIRVEKNYLSIGNFNINDNIIIPDDVLNIQYQKIKNTMERIDLIDGVINENSDVFFLYENEWSVISSEDYKTLTGCDSTVIIEMIKFFKSNISKTA